MIMKIRTEGSADTFYIEPWIRKPVDLYPKVIPLKKIKSMKYEWNIFMNDIATLIVTFFCL